MKEIWIKIEETDREFCVSNQGRVMNMETGKVLKPRKTPSGYCRVNLTINGKRVDRYIHRLVASAFCIHPSGSDVVNHIDNNPENNRAENLEWTTQRKNVLYAMKQGRVLKFNNAIPVIGIKDGKETRYSSSWEAQEATGCDHKSIQKCCKHIFKHSKGYVWKYAEVV